MWKVLFIVVVSLLSQAHAASIGKNDVETAEDARRLLWKLPNVGKGKETVCRDSDVKVKAKFNIRSLKPSCKGVEWDNVVLAVKQPLKDFVLVKARMDTCTSLTPGFTVTCARNYLGETNGLNTEFVVSSPFGFKVYAIRRLGNTPYGRQEMVYSPFTAELNTPLVISLGKKYLNQVITQATEELRRGQVRSLAFPGRFVADLVHKDVIHKLALIEHMDVVRFEKEKTQVLVNEVYTTLALNKGGAYNLAPSSASAHGLFQVIPETYNSLVRTYPAARLIFNYYSGTHDHVNAAKAAMLLADHDLSLLTTKDRAAVYANKELYQKYIASSYNGGPSCPKSEKRNGLCARQMLEKHGEFVKNNPNQENRTYVRKMDAVTGLR
jgi:hypothetical protein